MNSTFYNAEAQIGDVVRLPLKVKKPSELGVSQIIKQWEKDWQDANKKGLLFQYSIVERYRDGDRLLLVYKVATLEEAKNE